MSDTSRETHDIPLVSEPARPPQPETSDGDLRRVGVEIEFAGLDVPRAAALTQDVFGGRIVGHEAHRLTIEKTEFGAFIVELDAQIVHKDDAPKGGAEKVIPEDADASMREVLGNAVTGIVPVEIVTPPLPWNELGRLDELVTALRDAGAKGTDDNFLYAFGLHLNPELATTDAAAVTQHLRAYFVLVDWLRAEINLDTTRRLLPHADPFPKDYILKVLDVNYRPDLRQLIDDYLDANATRNRDLDMLPLFRHLDEEAVTSRLDDLLIKPRPTFHYRLPDCALADPNWNPVVEWNRWVKVEELAADADRLAELAQACRANLLRPAPERWLDDIKAWLER